ncbi:MAG: hypothetical protein IH945_10115, partial [Armatimonadetes bacterium]|nr:hypothetical protein [Armatimonadota bacterium]
MRRWRHIVWASLVVVVVVAVVAYNKYSAIRDAFEFPEGTDPWVLEWTDPTNDTPAYLSDGGTGVRIGRDGAVLVTVKEDAAYSSSGNDVPEIDWYVDGVLLDPTKGTNYVQTLDLRNGALETSWKQQIGTKKVFVSRKAVFDGELINPSSFRSNHDAVLSQDGPDLEGIIVELKAGVEWNDGSSRFISTIKRKGTPDIEIEIDGPIEDQKAIRSFLFNLQQSFGADVPPGPMGQSNDTYKGHIFWDSDVWMFPALALVDPESAARISKFRSDTAFAVQEAYLRSLGGEWIDVADSIMRRSFNAPLPDVPLRFPWEQSPLGEDVSEGPTSKEDHQSGDVAWSLNLASALGFFSYSDSIGAAVATYYKSRLVQNENGQAEIRDVTGVDEWFEGDNCLYTNAIADWTIKKYLGEDVDMYYPRDEKG